MTKVEILNIWQEKWGDLDPKWKDQFLNSPYLDRIMQFDSQIIVESVSRSKRLGAILVACRGSLFSYQDAINNCPSCGYPITNIEGTGRCS